MLATIRVETWNVHNMQHIITNSKRWDYSDIPVVTINRLKDPPTWLKVATTSEKPPTLTHSHDTIRSLRSIENLGQCYRYAVPSKIVSYCSCPSGLRWTSTQYLSSYPLMSLFGTSYVLYEHEGLGEYSPYAITSEKIYYSSSASLVNLFVNLGHCVNELIWH